MTHILAIVVVLVAAAQASNAAAVDWDNFWKHLASQNQKVQEKKQEKFDDIFDEGDDDSFPVPDDSYEISEEVVQPKPKPVVPETSKLTCVYDAPQTQTLELYGQVLQLIDKWTDANLTLSEGYCHLSGISSQFKPVCETHVVKLTGRGVNLSKTYRTCALYPAESASQIIGCKSDKVDITPDMDDVHADYKLHKHISVCKCEQDNCNYQLDGIKY